MQRNLTRIGGHLGPIAEPAQVTAIAQADHRDAFFGGLFDTELRRVFADHLTETAIAIDDRERAGIEHHRRRLIGLQPAGAHPFEIFTDADHAVRVVPDEIGVDQTPRDRV